MLDGGDAGGFGGDVDVVGLLDFEQALDQIGAADRVAEAEAGDAGELGEGAEDDEAGVVGDQIDGGLAAELDVGLVEQHGCAVVQEPRQRVAGEEVADGVVRRGEDHDRVAVGRGGADGFDVESEAGAAGDGAAGHLEHVGEELVDAEGGGRDDDRALAAAEGAEQDVEQLVGAGAGDDVIGRDAGVVGDGFADAELLRVGIGRGAVRVGQFGLHRFQDERVRAEGVLVRVELEDVVRVHSQPAGVFGDGEHGGVALHGGDIGAQGGHQRSRLRRSSERAWASRCSARAMASAAGAIASSRPSEARTIVDTLRNSSTLRAEA